MHIEQEEEEEEEEEKDMYQNPTYVYHSVLLSHTSISQNIIYLHTSRMSQISPRTNQLKTKTFIKLSASQLVTALIT